MAELAGITTSILRNIDDLSFRVLKETLETQGSKVLNLISDIQTTINGTRKTLFLQGVHKDFNPMNNVFVVRKAINDLKALNVPINVSRLEHELNNLEKFIKEYCFMNLGNTTEEIVARLNAELKETSLQVSNKRLSYYPVYLKNFLNFQKDCKKKTEYGYSTYCIATQREGIYNYENADTLGNLQILISAFLFNKTSSEIKRISDVFQYIYALKQKDLQEFLTKTNTNINETNLSSYLELLKQNMYNMLLLCIITNTYYNAGQFSVVGTVDIPNKSGHLVLFSKDYSNDKALMDWWNAYTAEAENFVKNKFYDAFLNGTPFKYTTYTGAPFKDAKEAGLIDKNVTIDNFFRYSIYLTEKLKKTHKRQPVLSDTTLSELVKTLTKSNIGTITEFRYDQTHLLSSNELMTRYLNQKKVTSDVALKIIASVTPEDLSFLTQDQFYAFNNLKEIVLKYLNSEYEERMCNSLSFSPENMLSSAQLKHLSPLVLSRLNEVYDSMLKLQAMKNDLCKFAEDRNYLSEDNLKIRGIRYQDLATFTAKKLDMLMHKLVNEFVVYAGDKRVTSENPSPLNIDLPYTISLCQEDIADLKNILAYLNQKQLGITRSVTMKKSSAQFIKIKTGYTKIFEPYTRQDANKAPIVVGLDRMYGYYETGFAYKHYLANISQLAPISFEESSKTSSLISKSNRLNAGLGQLQTRLEFLLEINRTGNLQDLIYPTLI